MGPRLASLPSPYPGGPGNLGPGEEERRQPSRGPVFPLLSQNPSVYLSSSRPHYNGGQSKPFPRPGGDFRRSMGPGILKHVHKV